MFVVGPCRVNVSMEEDGIDNVATEHVTAAAENVHENVCILEGLHVPLK